MDFMVVQSEISIHFVVLLICATMFTIGIGLFIFDFIKYGRPTDEALEADNQGHKVDGYKIDGNVIENLTGTSEKKGKTVI